MKLKHFLALAETIKAYNQEQPDAPFTRTQLERLAEFCRSQNPDFKRERWLSDLTSQ